MSCGTVAEIQGEFGPLCISELLIQKLWLRQDFVAQGLRTLEGAPLRVLAPGRWNRLEGPDFRDARLEIGGEVVDGDVEIHWYRRDWQFHGHTHDPLYSGVLLHAVVFPPLPGERPVRTGAGRELPTLVLLPLLRKDLETIALAEALRGDGGDDPLDIAARLLERPLHERLEMVRTRALGRWLRKVRHAAGQLAAQPWAEALHRGCLEVLGYHRNRAPMLRIAQDWPLDRLAAERPSPEQLFEAHRPDWRLNGLRPANHPLLRLRQYLALVDADPQWPESLAGAFLPPEREFDTASPTSAARKGLRVREREDWLAGQLLHDAVGGTRLHTLACDLFLPMLAARELGAAVAGGGQGYTAASRTGNSSHTPQPLAEHAAPFVPDLAANPGPWFPLWYHWQVGDLPEGIAQILRVAEVTARPRAACNGLFQGGLQLCLEGMEALTAKGLGTAG